MVSVEKYNPGTENLSFVDLDLKNMSEWKLSLVRAAEFFYNFERKKGIDVVEVEIQFKLFFK